MAIIIRQAADIPTAQLDRLGPVNIPLSSPPAELAGRKYLIGRPEGRMMGVWECSPGRWRRTIMQEEFAHFIEGSARFVPEDGEPIDIRAGDTIWFPPDTRGVWEISENVRKVYIILYPRHRFAAIWSRVATALSACRRWADIRPSSATEADVAGLSPDQVTRRSARPAARACMPYREHKNSEQKT
jgi:uncharacterized cupin superfamily protein